MKSINYLSGLLAGLLTLGSVVNTYANTEAKRPDKPDRAQPVKQRPSISLPEKANGKKALGLLKKSGKLPEFARFYGMSEAQVTAIFQNDPSAYIDQKGALFYVEPAKEEATSPVGEEATLPINSGANELNIPLSETFLLESKPGSSKTLFLDFDGHVIQNTEWNVSYEVATIVNPPFDIDGNPGSFNTTELTRIQRIWKRVAEDFAAFDINVTTRDFGNDAIVRSSSSDTVFGSHVVITTNVIDSTKTFCSSCGGIAYVGAFDNVGARYKPAYVYFNKLGSNEKYIAEAISHEAGHNMGLKHDGLLATSTTGAQVYYSGHGSGETAWAPIMGTGYGKSLVQWSKGEYLNANQQEDDYLVMQNNSLYFDVDDYGDTPSNAEPLKAQTGSGFADFTLQGTLQGPNDVDLFKLTLGAGPLSIQAKPFHLSPNVDVLVTLLNDQGNALASANPAEQLAATLSTDIPNNGNYFIR
ncbi:MAG: zinc-dependent metalloprotease family protein, partial [Limnobacter sp.]|nr:zinc-dependent metalloprotease family protein [Limnobacter sp.]